MGKTSFLAAKFKKQYFSVCNCSSYHLYSFAVLTVDVTAMELKQGKLFSPALLYEWIKNLKTKSVVY